MAASCCKQVFYINSLHNVEQLVYGAIRSVLTGRPGPVVIAIPQELQRADISISDVLMPISYVAEGMVKPDRKIVREVEELFHKASNPLIIFGKGIRNEKIEDIAHIVSGNCPYITSYAAKGSVPVLSNYLGTIWYANADHIYEVLEKADMVLAIGEEFTAFSFNKLKSYHAFSNLVQVHADSNELGRSFACKLAVQSDIHFFLTNIYLTKKAWNIDSPLKAKKKSDTLSFITSLAQNLPEESTFFADVGNAGYAAISDMDLKEGQKFYTTGKFGLCGWSVPTAIGYAVSSPHSMVLSITGDLSFNMNMQELASLRRYKTKYHAIVCNNHGPQNILRDQVDELSKEIQSEDQQVNYKGIADAYGLIYQKVKEGKEIAELVKGQKNFLFEIELDRYDYPI